MNAWPEGAPPGVEQLAKPTPRETNTTVHFAGGTSLDIAQRPSVATARLEAAYDEGGRYASLTEARGNVAFANPVAVTYLEQRAPAAEGRDGDGVAAVKREANATLHFMDGTTLDVVQGISIANKRLEEARGSSGLFAYLTQPAGTAVYANRLAVTHITA
jgi:hypothetical protein